MKLANEFTFILSHMFAIILIVHCEHENFFEDTRDSEELVDPHSFFYDKHSKTVTKDIKMDIIQSNEVKNELSPYKPVDDHCNHEATVIFYKRLINLLLSNIRIEDENEVLIKGSIEIEVSHSQIEILKNFHIEKTSLREIDEILSNIIQQPHYNYMFGVIYMCDILHKGFQTVLKTVQEHPDGTIIIFAMLMVCLTFKMLRRGQKLPIFYIIQIILVLSFFMTWWQLMKEAEIKSIAAQMKFSEVPISCQPDKMSLWQKFISFFSNDDCEKYYEIIMSNPKLKITPAFALSHFITTVILHPVSHMGTVISDFINNATDNLPWTYGWIVKCMLFLCVGFVIIMIPFFLSGASFNLGLGPLLRFGISHEGKNEKGNTLRSLENREPVQVILQVAHGTDVQQIQDMPKVKQSITPPVLKDYCEEETIAIDNIQKSYDDLSCGDTIKTNKLTSDHDEKLNKSEKLDATTIENKDGRGDG
ncbi:chloride channel CLIC-like protein 1 isoform X1 [Frieseomelitta varia]|uniref:chloride channel CLIC-like protein 1 isoform X1 n=1 Tax=Frieseomelitta varia TaxID=561572 RepID=UPI001CB67ACF|nr:chloride channel CLIC-like protein 1 isoform X1 [Frieseomelitta varia]